MVLQLLHLDRSRSGLLTTPTSFLPPPFCFPVNLWGKKAPWELTFNSAAVTCTAARLENLAQGFDVCRAGCISLWLYVAFIIFGIILYHLSLIGK